MFLFLIPQKMMAEPQGHLPAGTFAPAKAGSSPNNVEFEFSYHDVPTFN